MTINYRKLVDEYLQSKLETQSEDDLALLSTYRRLINKRMKNNVNVQRQKNIIKILEDSKFSRRSHQILQAYLDESIEILFHSMPGLSNNLLQLDKNESILLTVRRYILKFSKVDDALESYSIENHFLHSQLKTIAKILNTGRATELSPRKFRQVIQRNIGGLVRKHFVNFTGNRNALIAQTCNILVNSEDYKASSVGVDESRIKKKQSKI